MGSLPLASPGMPNLEGTKGTEECSKSSIHLFIFKFKGKYIVFFTFFSFYSVFHLSHFIYLIRKLRTMDKIKM